MGFIPNTYSKGNLPFGELAEVVGGGKTCLWNKKNQCYPPFFRKPKVGVLW
jgi:hypothetical protein